MGPIVRLVGSGIGLASEAIAARKASKADKAKAQTQASSTSQAFSHSSAPSASREPSPEPPAYSSLDPSSTDYGLVEAHDEDHARQLIDKGHAVPWDEPHEGQHEDAEDDDDEAYVRRTPFDSTLYYSSHKMYRVILVMLSASLMRNY